MCIRDRSLALITFAGSTQIPTMSADLFKDLVSHSKEYGFIFPSSEIYDGLGGVYDYGPYGVELKNNIKNYWWKAMVQNHENIVGLDAAIMMLSLIHISEPTRLLSTSYAVFCLK